MAEEPSKSFDDSSIARFVVVNRVLERNAYHAPSRERKEGAGLEARIGRVRSGYGIDLLVSTLSLERSPVAGYVHEEILQVKSVQTTCKDVHARLRYQPSQKIEDQRHVELLPRSSIVLA